MVYRLSDSNMVSICNQIEALYREQSRADMNDCLRELVIEMSMSDILTPERLSMELAMLVALLHNNIGTEIGTTIIILEAAVYILLFLGRRLHLIYLSYPVYYQVYLSISFGLTNCALKEVHDVVLF